VRVRGVISSANVVLHPWLREQLSALVQALPPARLMEDQAATRTAATRTAATRTAATRAQWERWQEGLTEKFSLLEELPPLRMLLIWDNLAGHKTPALVCWLMRHGILPLDTPLRNLWAAVGSTGRNLSSGFWCNVPCRVSTHGTRLKLSSGSKRRHAAGTSSRHRLCGVEHVMRDASVPGSGGVPPLPRCMHWVVQEPVRLRSSRMPEQHNMNGYEHTG